MQSRKDKVIQGYRVTDQKIGGGAFGMVYLGYNQQGEEMAVKVIPRNDVSGKTTAYLYNQILALKSCSNEHIVKFIDIKKTSSNYYVFIQYCDGGDLGQYIKSKGKIPEEEALLIFYQIVKGFRTIVKKSLVHRDLKPANILMKGGKVKIGDFGLAKLLSADCMTNTFAGSPYNMAPEVLKHRSYNNKADIYSVGTVLYQMIFGNPPFVGFKPLDLIEQIKARRFHMFDSKLVSKQTAGLLSRMLKQDPEQRIGWEELFNYEGRRKEKVNAKLYSKYQEYLSKINFSKLCAIPGILCLMSAGNAERNECTDPRFIDLNLSSALFVNLIRSTCIQE